MKTKKQIWLKHKQSTREYNNNNNNNKTPEPVDVALGQVSLLPVLLLQYFVLVLPLPLTNALSLGNYSSIKLHN
jgi:hypothetical protein